MATDSIRGIFEGINENKKDRSLPGAAFTPQCDRRRLHQTSSAPHASVADLKGLKVGTFDGYSYGSAFAAAASTFSVDPEESPMMNLRKLLAKRVDVAIIIGPLPALCSKRCRPVKANKSFRERI